MITFEPDPKNPRYAEFVKAEEELEASRLEAGIPKWVATAFKLIILLAICGLIGLFASWVWNIVFDNPVYWWQINILELFVVTCRFLSNYRIRIN